MTPKQENYGGKNSKSEYLHCHDEGLDYKLKVWNSKSEDLHCHDEGLHGLQRFGMV